MIIGRLNAFEIKESGGTATVEDLNVEFKAHSPEGQDGPARRAARRRREHRGREHPRRRRPRARQGRGLRGARGARGRARRRRRGDPRGGRRGLVLLRRPDRPDGQDRRAEALSRGGHLRRDPAQGRHAGLREHRGHQQGLERPDLRVLRPRHHRRPEQDRPQAHRGREGEEGLIRERRPQRVSAAGRLGGGVRRPADGRPGRADRGRRRDRRRRSGRAWPARSGCCSCWPTTRS